MSRNEAMAIYYARLVMRGAKTIEQVPEEFRDLTIEKTKSLEPLKYEDNGRDDSENSVKEG